MCHENNKTMLEQNPKHYLVMQSSKPKTRGVPIDLDGLYHDKPLKGGADNPIIYPWYDYEKSLELLKEIQ